MTGLTDIFLSYGKDHGTSIEKEYGYGVRIYGLKSEDIHSCWTALKSYVDSNITVTSEISIGFWEAKYLQSKHCNFIQTLVAEGCKVQLPPLTTKQESAKVKVVLTGKLVSTKQAREKIKNVCSQCLVQSVKLNCSTKCLGVWLKRWEDFAEEQEKNNVMIEFQHKHQPAENQVVEFTIIGTDSTAVATAKDDIFRQENGSKDKLAKLDVVLTSQDFIVMSKNLKKYEAKLEQTQNMVVVELEPKRNVVQLLTAPNKKSMLSNAQKELSTFIASITPPVSKSVTKDIMFKDKVIGSLLTSRTEHLARVEREAAMFSVSVQPDQSHPDTFILKLSGSGVEVKVFEEFTMDTVIKEVTAKVKHAQLIVGGHNLSILSTDSFKSFCYQLFKDLHVTCIYYPPLGGDLLRQVQLRSKADHIVTLQIAIGHLSNEKVDAIVVPAESHDKTIINVEMNFEYFRYLQKKPLSVGEVACINSGSFPSTKALHVLLPKRCQQVEKQVDFVTACSTTLECASSNHFGSLSFPALGVDDVHKISTTLCINTLLFCVDKHCLESQETTLHTVRIVITQDLVSSFLNCFDKYTFRALQTSESDKSFANDSIQLTVSTPQYNWYWQDDKKQFTQYSQAISDTLTRAKKSSLSKKCYFQVDGKMYAVDLSAMTQRNCDTGFTRKMMCKEIPSKDDTPEASATSLAGKCSTNCEVQWYYRDDKRKFAAYTQADSVKIENMYQNLTSAGKYLQIQSRIYRFDFENMKQMNISTQYQRDIKREELPSKQQGMETAEVDGFEVKSSLCIINLRGPIDNLETAKQKVKDKLESLATFRNVPLPVVSTLALKQKLCSIARRHSVSSSIRDDGKPKHSGASHRRFSQVIRIEGAEHLVDKAVTEVQGEIIEFQSQSSSASASQADTQYPPEWEAQTSTSQLFELDKYSREWIQITSKFRETMPDAEILSIKRIQNKWLWGRYSQHKDRMHEKNSGVVNEKDLWHGSRKSSADNIYACEEGFDMRHSSEGLWGQANYFAEKASYSDKYAFKSTGSTKELLLAKVLTGDSFDSPPDGSLRMPPEKPKSSQLSSVQLKNLRYDSVTGVTCSCRVYMTYSNDKAYPAYLVCYSTTQKIPLPRTASQSLFARFQAQFSGFTQ